MTGALPPSSKWLRLTLLAATSMIFWPVEISPVIEIICTCGCEIIDAPTDSPRPFKMLTTPSGKMSAISSASLSVVSGVNSDGFSTTVLPAAKAGPNFHAAIING